MNLLQTPKMIFSFHEGWDELIHIHPSVVRLFAWVVLPLSTTNVSRWRLLHRSRSGFLR